MSVRSYRPPHQATVELPWERRFTHARRALDTAADMLTELARLCADDGDHGRAMALSASAKVVRHIYRSDQLNPEFNNNGRPRGRQEV